MIKLLLTKNKHFYNCYILPACVCPFAYAFAFIQKQKSTFWFWFFSFFATDSNRKVTDILDNEFKENGALARYNPEGVSQNRP